MISMWTAFAFQWLECGGDIFVGLNFRQARQCEDRFVDADIVQFDYYTIILFRSDTHTFNDWFNCIRNFAHEHGARRDGCGTLRQRLRSWRWPTQPSEPARYVPGVVASWRAHEAGASTRAKPKHRPATRQRGGGMPVASERDRHSPSVQCICWSDCTRQRNSACTRLRNGDALMSKRI